MGPAMLPLGRGFCPPVCFLFLPGGAGEALLSHPGSWRADAGLVQAPAAPLPPAPCPAAGLCTGRLCRAPLWAGSSAKRGRPFWWLGGTALGVCQPRAFHSGGLHDPNKEKAESTPATVLRLHRDHLSPHTPCRAGTAALPLNRWACQVQRGSVAGRTQSTERSAPAGAWLQGPWSLFSTFTGLEVTKKVVHRFKV